MTKSLFFHVCLLNLSLILIHENSSLYQLAKNRQLFRTSNIHISPRIPLPSTAFVLFFLFSLFFVCQLQQMLISQWNLTGIPLLIVKGKETIDLFSLHKSLLLYNCKTQTHAHTQMYKKKRI